jgi:hypothetical protein
LILLACAAIAAGYAVHAGGPELASAVARPSFVPLVTAAFVTNVAGLVMAMLSWQAILVRPGETVPLPAAARMFFVGLLGKLLPGRVWGIVAQVQLGRTLGFSASRTVGAFLLAAVVAVVTAGAVGSMAAPVILDVRAGWVLVTVLVVVVMLVWPRSLNRLTLAAARLVRRPSSVALASPAALRRAVLLAVASWLVTGLHVWSLALLFGAPAVAALPVCIGAFALATAAGVLVVVLPDGWGVRDALLLGALSTVMAPHAAGLTVLASRLVCAASDITAAGLSIALAGFAGRFTQPLVVPERKLSWHR